MSAGEGRGTPYDALVVGAGPAGLAAATWLARYRRDVLVVDSGEYRAAQVVHSHGYLGRDPQRPLDLLARGRADLLSYATAHYRPGQVTSVSGCTGDFRAELDDGSAVRALRLVLACGVRDAFPDLPGFAVHYGASVFHCPSCDGYDARDHDVVAYGWSEHLAGFAVTLLDWARSVTVVTGGRRFTGDGACHALLRRHDVELVEEDVVELVGERGDLRSVRLAGGRELRASRLFFSVAHEPRTQLARMLGCAIDEDGYVVIDRDGRTSVPGVFSAGDVVPGLQLVQVAAGEGAAAGVTAARSLHGEPGSAASPPAAPDIAAELRAP